MKLNKYLKWAAVLVMVCILGALFMMHSKEQDASYTCEVGMESPSESVSEKESEEVLKASMIYVEICGCVHSPGVYEVAEGTRVFEVIEMAGGMSGNAKEKSINQAALVSDGQQIYIPSKDEELLQSDTASGNLSENLININSAGADELMTLPGIGESKAESIIAYRENTGRFEKIEDIMNVSGIKEAAFEKIKELICV